MIALPGMTIDCVPTSSFHPLTISGSPSERRRLTHGVASARVASRICNSASGWGLGLAWGDAPGEGDDFAAGLACPDAGGVGLAALCVGFGGVGAGALDVQAARTRSEDAIRSGTIGCRSGRRLRVAIAAEDMSPPYVM